MSAMRPAACGPTRRQLLCAAALAGGLGALPVRSLHAQSPARESTAVAAVAAATAVAVWDFDNQTPPGLSALPAGQLDYLRRALAEAVTQALLERGGLAVVERQRLRDVLAEQKLGASELADIDARLRLGRIVGASRMVFGGYFALGEEVQVTVRVVDSATSRVLLADEFSAPAPAVMARIETTAGHISHALGGVSASGREYPAALWQAYDRALALSDAGQVEQAVAALQALLASQKDFTPAERQLVALLDKLSRR